MTSDPSASPGAIVSRFIAHIESFDLDAALCLLTEDCVYDNVPFGAVSGHDAVRSVLAPFMAGFDVIEWVMIEQLETGTVESGTVLNERLDRFGATASDGTITWLELPIAGRFDICDGRISLWRDYFDRAPLVEGMTRHG